jgi:hypothetical protein
MASERPICESCETGCEGLEGFHDVFVDVDDGGLCHECDCPGYRPAPDATTPERDAVETPVCCGKEHKHSVFCYLKDAKPLPPEEMERIRAVLKEGAEDAVKAVRRREELGHLARAGLLPLIREIQAEARKDADTWWTMYQAWQKRATEAETREAELQRQLAALTPRDEPAAATDGTLEARIMALPENGKVIAFTSDSNPFCNAQFTHAELKALVARRADPTPEVRRRIEERFAKRFKARLVDEFGEPRFYDPDDLRAAMEAELGESK